MRRSRPTTGTVVPIRDRLERLDGLPLRPATVRSLVRSASESPEPIHDPSAGMTDPGWAVLVSSLGIRQAIEALPDLPLWPPCDGQAAEARDRLWRFSVATSVAARRLSGQAGDPDPDASGRAGLLHRLALWALAAVSPDALAQWISADADVRRRLEASWFGCDPATLGLSLARRWGCEPIVRDAVLLAGRSAPIPDGLTDDPARLDPLRLARAWAMQTPWALPGPRPSEGPDEPDRRQLIAEVQSRTVGDLASSECPTWAGDLLREASRLLVRNQQLEADRADLSRRLEAALDGLDEAPAAESARREAAVLDAMAEFAGGAAHELNNPLAIVAGRAQLLQARLSDPDQRNALQTIIDQARRAHQILRDLIYIARPPAPRHVPCVPDQVLKDVVNDLARDARRREIRLSCRTRQSPVTMSTDPEALRHLADALIRNALESTKAGGEVVVESIDDSRWIVWVVRDDGIGLDADRAAHLLDPFYCGRQAGRGLGLGLPRVARFVRSVGGEIGWGPADGRGTIVRIRLPMTSRDGPSLVAPPRSGLRDAG